MKRQTEPAGKSHPETVIIVHGTFAAPEPGERTWYQPGDDFVAHLDAALAQRGSTARCWSHLSGQPPFSWSGENNWLERTRAAADLIAHVDKLAPGQIFHLVGHSHGGNVIADAIPQLLSSSRNKANLGRVVTLGTPFLDTTTAVENKRTNVRLWQLRATMIGAWLFAVLILLALLGSIDEAQRGVIVGWLFGCGLLITMVMIGLHVAAARRIKRIEKPTPREFGLALTSKLDEAWQLLHHVREAPNPLAIGQPTVMHLANRVAEQFSRNRQISRLHGSLGFSDVGWASRAVILLLYLGVLPLLALGWFQVSSQGYEAQRDFLIGMLVVILGVLATGIALGHGLLSATFSPFRAIGHALGSIATIPGEMGAVIARQQGWGLIQSFTLGLDGFRNKPPPVMLTPQQLPAGCFRVEMLPSDVEMTALEKRTLSIGKGVEATSALFAGPNVAGSDLQSLLVTISKEATLVHAAYYQDPACIDRIAEWIAAKDSNNPSAKSGIG